MRNKKWVLGTSALLLIAVVVLVWVIGANDAVTKAKQENSKVAATIKEEDMDKEKEKEDEKDKLDAKGTELEDEKKEENESTEKEEETKETVTEKEDGTTVKVAQSSGNTPSATVKVEKSKTASSTSGFNTSSNSSSTSNSSSSNNQTSSKSASKTTTKITTSTESIAYKTVNQNDSSLDKGKTSVAQNGQEGVKTITYKETYVDGKLKSKDETSSKVTKNPVDKIVKVGTKEVSQTLSRSQAESVLGGSVLRNAGSSYVLDDPAFGEILMVSIDGDGVSNIRYNGNAYISLDMSKSDWISIVGEEQGTAEYNNAQSERKTIEKAARSAANAVYGSGTSKANSLYSQIIGSNSFGKSF